MKLRLIFNNDSFDDIFVESETCGTKIDTRRFIRLVRSTVERNKSSTLELEQHVASPRVSLQLRLILYYVKTAIGFDYL